MQEQICGIIGQAIAQYNALLGETDTADITKQIIERKKEELLKQAKEILPKEEFFIKEPKNEEEEIKELAKIGVKLKLYAYRHKDEIKSLKEQIEELRTQEKTEANREELLQKIESLETKYKVFGRYVTEEDWESLYRTKFDILMCDINQRQESPILELDETAYEREIPIYARILEEKIEAIITGTNPELRRAFLEEGSAKQKNMLKALRIIKDILQAGEKKFDIEAILRDKNRLRLLLAFDKEGGLEEINLNNVEEVLNTKDFVWEDKIPAKTVLEIINNPEYKQYKNINARGIYYTLYGMYNELQGKNKNEIEEGEKKHIIPEGIKKINEFKPIWNACDFRLVCPSTLKAIGDRAFNNFDNLTEIVFQEGLESIGDWAFCVCRNLKKAILPEGLKSIGDGAFYECLSLKKAILPEGLETIGSSAFSETGIKETSIPSTLENISANAFSRCRLLEKAVLSEGLKSIGNEAFYESGLREIRIPSTTEKLGMYAFYGCKNLQTVSLPSTVKNMDVGRCF